MTENEISYRIIGAAIKLHKQFGPGLLESVYEDGLTHDLIELGLVVETQVALPFVYKNIRQDVGYRIDMIVNKMVIVEIKAVECIAPVHFAQTLTYLKLANLKLGLLMNFDEAVLKNGVFRIANGL